MTWSIPAGYASSPASPSLSALAPGFTYHVRLSATSAAGVAGGGDQTFTTPPFFAPGDLNGDGVVAAGELDAVYAGYWHSNSILMTNAFGVGCPTVQLAVVNVTNWGLTIEISTDLVTWVSLPQRTYPVFQFFDPDATNCPVRFYRLVAP